jgi:hypothetical protein
LVALYTRQTAWLIIGDTHRIEARLQHMLYNCAQAGVPQEKTP